MSRYKKEDAFRKHVEVCMENMIKEFAELDKKYGVKSTTTSAFSGTFLGGGLISMSPMSLPLESVYVEGTDVWVHNNANLEFTKKELETLFENPSYKLSASAMMAWIDVQMKIINKKYCEQ